MFHAPWRHPERPLIIDAYWDNPIGGNELATESRVAAIIHKASEMARFGFSRGAGLFGTIGPWLGHDNFNC